MKILFKTIEIDKNFNYKKCRAGSRDCEENYKHYFYENNAWIPCTYQKIDQLHYLWLRNENGNSISFEDENGDTIFCVLDDSINYEVEYNLQSRKYSVIFKNGVIKEFSINDLLRKI